MTKFTFLTLFPRMYESFANDSILKRAKEGGFFEYEIANFRDYTNHKNLKVDDYPFGGGAGMVIAPQPIVNALHHLKTPDSIVILTSASGKKYDQKMAQSLSSAKHIIIIAGHYEGFDERILNYVDHEVSIGDFVLTGGEMPSMIMAESIIRLIPGVIKEDSLSAESFNGDLLEHPQYTRPAEFDGLKVPEVLLNGNHKLIAEFNLKESIKKTKQNRPDLYKNYKKNLKPKVTK